MFVVRAAATTHSHQALALLPAHVGEQLVAERALVHALEERGHRRRRGAALHPFLFCFCVVCALRALLATPLEEELSMN